MRSRIAILVTALTLMPAGASAADSVPPKLARTIPLPGVRGRIDHMILDEEGGRLFIAALGNNSVEIVDVTKGALLKSISELSEPQGVAIDRTASGSRLYVSCGDDGTLRVFDAATFDPVATVDLGDDADNVRLDAPHGRVLVGFGSGALAIVDTRTNDIVGEVMLPSHPESFQLDEDRAHAFVNLPGAHSIARVDLGTKSVTASWSPGFAAANYPMALDPEHRRLLIACRVPSRLLVIDADDGRHIARLDLHGDCDDVFYDGETRRIYASCGEGYVDVFSQQDSDHYTSIGSVETRTGARTSLLAGKSLFVAVPRSAGRSAEIRCYNVAPATDE